MPKWLFNTPARAPAHLPEVCLESGIVREDRNQPFLAGRRGVELGEMLQVRPRFRRDLLVRHAGVLGAFGRGALPVSLDDRQTVPASHSSIHYR